MYLRVVDQTFRRSKMISENDDIYNHINKEQSWYSSSFFFTEEHKKQFDKTKSISGIRNVVTNKLWWDFDCKNDISKAHESTKVLVDRLLKLGFKENNLQVKFSGGKGFHVIVEVDKMLNRDDVESICTKIAGDLLGFDTSVYLPTQILRIPLTKHSKTGLYARPIKVSDLLGCEFNEIKNSAKNIDDINVDNLKKYYQIAALPNIVYEYKNLKKEEVVVEAKLDNDLKFDFKQLDFTKKPKFLDNARWALQNGFFYGSESKPNGDRTFAMLCLAATYKNLGFTKEHVYRMLKGVAELQSTRTGESRFSEGELWNQIISSVYSPTWKGGQYTIHDKGNALYKYAIEYKIPMEDFTDEKPMTISEIDTNFSDFVTNIEANTVKIGIDELDSSIPITVGMNLGIIGAAGSGKTALALKILENTSKSGVISVFASLDMHRNRLFEKLLYRISGKSREEIYKIFRENGKEKDNLLTIIKKKYGNVYFYDKSSASVSDIREYVLKVEKMTGSKVKLVMLDYFERISSSMSDDTASSKKVSGEIQDMINDLNVAGITMVQPNKFSLNGGSDSPILNYTAIKGSSFLYQSFRGIISLWRPFYHPEWKEHDNYMSIAILKNDLGELNQFDFDWTGKTGDIKPLEDIQKKELEELLKMKKESKEDKKKDKNAW